MNDPAQRRILAIGAHAADMEFTCGMTLAKYVAHGGHAALLHLTPGERGHPRMGAEEYGAQKRAEAARAAAILGASLHMLDYSDATLPVNEEVALQVADVIREERPDIIITHWRNSIHKDHANTHRIVSDAILYAALGSIERSRPRHGVWNIYFTDNWEDQEDYVPDVFVDIDRECFDRWREAASAYELYRGGISSFRYADYYEALATVRGALARFRYANAFMLHPDARRRSGAWLPR
jgi:N-acetylglucosamine malate deacetylase 1